MKNAFLSHISTRIKIVNRHKFIRFFFIIKIFFYNLQWYIIFNLTLFFRIFQIIRSLFTGSVLSITIVSYNFGS